VKTLKSLQKLKQNTYFNN